MCQFFRLQSADSPDFFLKTEKIQAICFIDFFHPQDLGIVGKPNIHCPSLIGDGSEISSWIPCEEDGSTLLEEMEFQDWDTVTREEQDSFSRQGCVWTLEEDHQIACESRECWHHVIHTCNVQSMPSSMGLGFSLV